MTDPEEATLAAVGGTPEAIFERLPRRRRFELVREGGGHYHILVVGFGVVPRKTVTGWERRGWIVRSADGLSFERVLEVEA